MVRSRMEHPIPANVTSFQFHLVGDMTLKQFSYLGTGLGFAYFIFVTIFPLSPYLALPIIILSTISGAAFAFVPILDRPLDHWMLAFFKAVYSPTQGKWKSPLGKDTPSGPVFINRLQLYLSPTTSPRLSRITPIKATTPSAAPATPSIPSPVPQVQPQQPQPPLNQSTPNIPSSEELSNLVNMAKEVQVLQAKISQTEKQVENLKFEYQTKEAKTPEYANKIKEASENLQNLIKQTEELYHHTSNINTVTPIRTKIPEVVIVPASKPQKTALLLTSFPNVINGIVTDPQGNYLDGVIVIIHDKENIPVRALKTNKLGQFTGATPLPSGLYTITLEKEGFEFNALQLTLNDDILSPLQIQPKKGRE